MGKFDFYDIEMLVERGVSNDLLREIVADANRFRVVQNGELPKALVGSGLPLLTPNKPSDWNGQIDSFINAHFTFEGAFNVGDRVVDHYAHPLAENWYKQLTGLEAKILRGWTEDGRTQYEIEIDWNKHRGVCTEQRLLVKGDYEPPWWCSEVLQQRKNQLYVRLAAFNNGTRLLEELCTFTQRMSILPPSNLHLYAEDDEGCQFRARFTIEYNTRLSFYTGGQRTNRKAIIALLSDLSRLA